MIHVRMVLRFYNKNVVGIQYGGSLFSMTDPCYMFMLMKNLGSDYKVIDQSAAIEFITPGVGTVNAKCYLTQQDINEIITATHNGDKYLKTFLIDVIDDSNNVVAKVTRVVYIRKKQQS
jgi:acyl-coenzyme A thioesterase PaaI-like protein